MNSKTNLYSFQQAAVDKLVPSKVGALFMEMGTGKTRTAIELVCLRQKRIDKAIWFCPVSLKETVRYEIHKHTDDTRICVFDDKTNMRNVLSCFWYIVGIESMSSSDRAVLTANSLITDNTFIIVDESSYIKGHDSLRTKRITRMAQRARYRLILTGTPMSQGVVDLYAQMYFLSPQILGYRSFYSFAANHLEYSEKYPGLIVRSHNTKWLAVKIQPYVYQVTKEECLDLPPKLHDSRYFGMTSQQREAYEQAKWDLLLCLDEDDIDSYAIFRLFNALQQIVSGFWNRGDSWRLEFPHARTDMLLDTIYSLPADAKIIIWCKYIYSIHAITNALHQEFGQDSVALFYGDLNEKERNAELDRFRNDARFFVATQATGGHGLTLNEAHHVVFYENEFKYSNRLQAEDRCHRIGQELPVTYIDITCSHSIDERIQDALAKKANAAQEFKRQVDAVKGAGREKLKEMAASL